MTTVVAVADHSGRQARLVAALSLAFRTVGLNIAPRTQRELAAEVSIWQSTGRRPVVDPDRPLLWLSPADRSRSDAPEDRFLSSEAHSAARSVATLTCSPVLNRPSAVSLCGAFPSGRPGTVRSARRHDAEAGVRAERFTGSWWPNETDTGPLEVWDYATGRSSYGFAASSCGPFRQRPALGSAGLVKVRVVGDQTVADAPDLGPDIRAASCRITAGYQLDMATFWWLVGPGEQERTLARVDCWLWDAEAGPGFATLAEAVAAWMGDRLVGDAL